MILARDVLQRVVDILQDSTSVRWPTNELIRYLNDGQREIALYRPDALVRNATVSLANGSRQQLPDGSGSDPAGSKLIEVIRNNVDGGSKRAIRLVNREVLDSQTPGWHDITPTTEVIHYMYDPRDPLIFYVYPPATTSARLDITYSIYPEDIAPVSDGAEVPNIPASQVLTVPDIYANVVQDYVLYKCYMKDSEYAGNANRAQAHYNAFANALGLEIQATIQVGPRSVSNPNVTAPAAP